MKKYIIQTESNTYIKNILINNTIMILTNYYLPGNNLCIVFEDCVNMLKQ